MKNLPKAIAATTIFSSFLISPIASANVALFFHKSIPHPEVIGYPITPTMILIDNRDVENPEIRVNLYVDGCPNNESIVGRIALSYNDPGKRSRVTTHIFVGDLEHGQSRVNLLEIIPIIPSMVSDPFWGSIEVQNHTFCK